MGMEGINGRYFKTEHPIISRRTNVSKWDQTDQISHEETFWSGIERVVRKKIVKLILSQVEVKGQFTKEHDHREESKQHRSYF
jgi:hypothetical protein